MKYNIDLNDNDYIEFNYSYLKHSKIGKYSLLATRISFPIAMFVFVLALLIIKIEIGLCHIGCCSCSFINCFVVVYRACFDA